MKRQLLILALVLLTTASASAQTAYAVWCAGSKTLYFDYTTAAITVGGTYDGESVTNVWSGEAVTNSGFVYRTGRSEPTYCAWYDAAHAQAEKVVIKHAFSDAPVTRTDGWFMKFSKLTTVEGLSNIPRGITKTAHMFNECSSLTSLDLSGFDTSKSTSMAMMFHGCKALTTINLTGFDTSSCKSMERMFYNCSKLTSLDLSNFNTSNVTTMMMMFEGCSKLKSLDFSSFDTSNVTSMRDMFSWCTSLTSLDLSSFNTSNVTTMMQMFDFCSSLVTLDLSNFDLSKVETMSGMFGACSQLQTIYCNATIASNVENAMFSDCTSLVGAVAFDSSKTGSDMANPDTGYFTRKEPEEVYGITINGTSVTSLNKDDLTKINGVSASEGGYARFDPETNTLTLCGVEVADIAIADEMGDLTIETEGEQPVKVVDTSGDGWYLKSARITGTAPMEVSGGIVVGERLVLDGIDLTVTGHAFGIKGSYSYSFDMFGDMVDAWSGILEMKGKSKLSLHSDSFCVGPLAEIKLGENIRVTEPAGAEVRTFLSDYQSSLSESTYQDVSVRNSDDQNSPNAASDKHWGYDRVSGTVVIAYSSEPMPTLKRGDVNKDGKVDISDIVAVINTIAGDPTYKETAKVNDDDKVDISDIVAIINIIASGDGGSSQTETDAAVEAGLCPDTKHPHAIDLGDGVKWACCNVGASAPWENGGYYAWGETEEKDLYYYNNYTHCDGEEINVHDLGSDISGTQYDVAHVKWGGGWKMPSDQQFGLLINCSSEWTSVNGVKGCKVTGANGASIFLPAAGNRSGDTSSSGLNYWSSTPYDLGAYVLAYHSLYQKGLYMATSARFVGMGVRPIKQTDAAVEAGLCPDTKHPHAIDLGDGVLWSCCNVGASAPWEYGGYYAWGETEEKSTYDWTTYSHCDGSKETCHDLGSDIAGTQYDVAYVKWGNGWKMPSYEQFGLLKDNCSSEWKNVNGVSGIKVIGSNGRSIFLPAAGYRWDDYTSNVGSYGYYWSSSQNPYNSYSAYRLYFGSGGMNGSRDSLYFGRSVRPVK